MSQERTTKRLDRDCYLRKAEWEDLDLLFQWVNEKEVRKNSFSEAEVTYEEHKEWFRKKREDENAQIYILCDGKREIGVLRLDYKDSIAQISYSITAEYRGRGYGEALILLAEEKVRRRFRNEEAEIKALVKEENLPSNKIFLKCGYEKQGIEYIKKVGWENKLK